MNKNFYIRLYNGLILLLVLILSISLISCINTMKEKKGSIYAFSTYIDITLYYNDNQDIESIYKNVVNIFNEINKLTDRFNEYPNINNIYKINNSKDFVSIDSKLIELITLAQSIKKETNGYFECLIGNLSVLYKELIKSEDFDISKIPTEEEIEIELENIKNTEIIIQDNLIKLDGKATIDLGAVAKGYALLKVKEYLDEVDITHFIIDAGMSSILVGEKPIDDFYSVLVSNTGDVKKIKNCCFGTSSVLTQKIEYNGTIYHHIINPKTGKPENYYKTVCVIGDDPLLIDALTTAFISMKEEEIKEVINLYKQKNINLEYYLY